MTIGLGSKVNGQLNYGKLVFFLVKVMDVKL
jgi:hypothetical protein